MCKDRVFSKITMLHHSWDFSLLISILLLPSLRSDETKSKVIVKGEELINEMEGGEIFKYFHVDYIILTKSLPSK